AARGVQHAVPAHDAELALARCRAPVAAPPVAVVAFLARRHDAVPAGGRRAVRIAPVAIDGVPVVARLAPGDEHPVAAHDGGLGLARSRAPVARDRVPVVTFLSRIEHPVSAGPGEENRLPADDDRRAVGPLEATRTRLDAHLRVATLTPA